MKLKEIVEICYGKNQKQVEVEKSDIPILGTGGVIGYSSMSLYDKESVLIGRKGTIGMPFYVNKPFWTIDTLFYTKINTNIVIPKYLYYLLCTIGLSRYSEGAAVPSLTTKTLYEIDLNVPSKDIQQHIVNTIGSVDDLIENLVKQNELIMNLGILKINSLNNINELKSLSIIVYFEKGFEVGSSNYIENCDEDLIQYLRVGDLLSLGNTFIDKSISNKISKFDDILVAFDGAPGRNNIGLNGAYSSGIYNLKCTNSNKGLVYFEINSDINKKIIDNHSQGTTILHASKSINYLVYANIDEKNKDLLNTYFNLLLQNKKKINSLKHIKANLLNKYF